MSLSGIIRSEHMTSTIHVTQVSWLDDLQGVPKRVSHEIKNKIKNTFHHFFSNIIIVCVSPSSSPSNTLDFITIDHLIAEIWSITVTTVQIPPWPLFTFFIHVLMYLL